MRKNRIYYVIAAIFLIMTGGCKDDNYDMTGSVQPSLTMHYIYTSASAFDSPYPAAFNESFRVYSLDTPWEFSNSASWITLSPERGSATADVIMNVGENLSTGDPRTAVFFLKSGDPEWTFSKGISVTQGAAVAIFTPELEELNFPGGASTKTISYSTNSDLTVTPRETWIHTSLDASASTITVSVDANPSNSSRRGDVKIDFGDRTAYIYVVQAASVITGSTDILDFDNLASAYTVVIDAEVEWNAITSESWIQITPSEGKAGVSEVLIEAAPNTSVSRRSGYVNFNSSGATKWTVEVRQKGLYFEPLLSTMNFSAGGESLELNVSSNTAWQVESCPNWVSVSPVEGVGDGKVTVTAAENESIYRRYGEIVFYQPGLDMTQSVSLSQEGVTFSADHETFEYGAQGGSLSLNITANGSWTTEVSDDWIVVDPAAGKGNAVVRISVGENNTAESRSGTVIFRYAEFTHVVTINQLGKYITISNENFEFTSRGGVHLLEISTNDSWSARIEGDPDWLTLSSTSGTGDAVINITASDNPSVNLRSATVVVDISSGQSLRILVSQKPRTLSVSMQSIILFAEGGDSQIVTIHTDGQYVITTQGDWFTIHYKYLNVQQPSLPLSSKSNSRDVSSRAGKTVKNNAFYISASENPSKEARRGKVIISLTDLKEGSLSLEIPVIQSGEGCTFILNPFQPADSDWDVNPSGDFGVTIASYSVEKDWLPKVTGGLTVNVTGFTTDHDWNRNEEFNSNVKISQYGQMLDWNGQLSGSAIFKNSGYSDDASWIPVPISETNFKGSGFAPDSDYLSGQTDEADFTVSDFTPDRDWNNE